MRKVSIDRDGKQDQPGEMNHMEWAIQGYLGCRKKYTRT